MPRLDSLGQGDGLLIGIEPFAGLLVVRVDGRADAQGDEFFLPDSSSEAFAEIPFVGNALGFHRGFECALALETSDKAAQAFVDFLVACGEWRVELLDLEAQQLVVDEVFQRGGAEGNGICGGISFEPEFLANRTIELAAGDRVAGDAGDDFRLWQPVASDGYAERAVENKKVCNQIGEDRAIDGEPEGGSIKLKHGR